ncbi:hypothetical protein KWB77_003545 [Vibrio cholerae]|nr:hypothetical protein [Vibrio cholerae]
MDVSQFESVDNYISSFCRYVDKYRENLNKQGIWLFLATLGTLSVEPDYIQLFAILITLLIFISKLYKEWGEEGAHFTFKVASALVESKIATVENVKEREFLHLVFQLKKEQKFNLMFNLKKTYIYVTTFSFFIICCSEIIVVKFI